MINETLWGKVVLNSYVFIEKQELISVIKKLPICGYGGEFSIRTSHDLERARQNIETMISQDKGQQQLIDLSPLGISSSLVEKPC